MSEEKCEFNMQGWCCCGLTTVPKEIGYADILCSDECNKNCYYKQLQTAKEENEKLRNLLGKPYKRRIDLENNKLAQQNKQMRDEISEIRNMINPDRSWESFDEWEQYIYKAVDKIDKLQQALKGVE